MTINNNSIIKAEAGKAARSAGRGKERLSITRGGSLLLVAPLRRMELEGPRPNLVGDSALGTTRAP
jgi:hypothetical protein